MKTRKHSLIQFKLIHELNNNNLNINDLTNTFSKTQNTISTASSLNISLNDHNNQSQINSINLSSLFPQFNHLFIKSQWILSLKQYTIEQINKLFQYLKTLHIKKLDLGWNQNHIVKDILLQINFPSLQQLNLSNNNIHSIENLQHLNASELHTIQLYKNSIANLSSIRKMNASKLYKIDLTKNQIKQFHGLSELSNKALSHIFINGRTGRNNQNQGNQSVWILKIQSSNILQATPSGKDTIKKLTKKELKKRFKWYYY